LGIWKATEYRQFALYLGFVALIDVLPPALYDHFVYFAIAMYILFHPRLATRYLGYASECLDFFVRGCSVLYGDSFVVYNVHNLIHLADDVRRFGDLNVVSAFPFENAYQIFNRLLHGLKDPVVQLLNRLAERRACGFMQNLPLKDASYMCLLGPGVRQHFLSTTHPDCYYLFKDGPARLVFIDDHEIRYLPFKVVTNIINKDIIHWRDFYIYECVHGDGEVLSGLRSDIISKCLVFPRNEGYICIPLLHTFLD